MSESSFLAGVLTAWTVVHIGLAGFFLLTFAFGRRETAYFLLGLLCAAFSILTGGTAYDHLSLPLDRRLLADQILHSGGVLAAAINVHFAACFSSLDRRARQGLGVLYGSCALLLIVIWTGAMYVPGSLTVVESRVLGFAEAHALGRVTWLGALLYGIIFIEGVFAVALLVASVRRGFPGAFPSLVGAGCVLLAIPNDVALGLGVLKDTLFLVPHALILYAFGAMASLIWHYRATAGALEQTTHRLEQRTEELRHSYAELAIVQNELSSKKQLAAVGELAAAIAHEVRNPLAVIVNAVSGLRRTGIADDDRSMLLGIVDEEAGRLNRLVTDLLRFARPVNVKRAPVSLVELANRCRINIPENFELVVEASTDPQVTTVHVDPNLFRLVFDNLVSNAFQSMREGGTIEISIEGAELRGAPASRIEIRDSGHGMELEVKRRALDPFFTTRPSGTGLGLPIVQRIVEAHGGELLIESEENEGTRITIIVPRAPSAESAVVVRTERVA